MQNRKQLRVIQSIVVVAALLTFAGCKSSGDKERSEGRVVDDKQITENVQKELKHDPVCKFAGVDVETFGGVVQLSGFVDSENQQQRALEIAKRIPGVREVINATAIKPEPITPTGSTNAVQPRIYSE